MSFTEEDERRAHVENMTADTRYKDGLLKYEPWKIVVAAVAAGGIFFGALGGVIGFLAGPRLPQTIIIQDQRAPSAR